MNKNNLWTVVVFTWVKIENCILDSNLKYKYLTNHLSHVI